jgi:hypothetical protein
MIDVSANLDLEDHSWFQSMEHDYPMHQTWKEGDFQLIEVQSIWH